MGLFPQIMLGALILAAFAFTAQQKLSLGSHNGPMPARQIAYLMRVHHQAAVNLKAATPSLAAVGDFGPPSMASEERVVSCIEGKFVVTGLFTIGDTTTLMFLPVVGTAESNAVAAELKRQSVLSPELGRLGQTPRATGYNGSPASSIAPVTQAGLSDEFPLIPNCLLLPGIPAMVTQVIP